jgi:eukaryotic-like serine/threonine-protein kinase
MDAKRWQKIEKLYHAALEFEGGGRGAFLAQACGGDSDLRREVETLLASGAAAGSFIESPALEVAAQALADNPSVLALNKDSLKSGATVAHYQILEKIGAGGMGEVYRARDTKLNRDVALKILPQRFGDDPERLSRFRREAQVLASLNHPHIAAIHGIEESGGIRALVMELVQGETLAQRLGRVGHATPHAVIPAQAGIQRAPEVDPRLRGGDNKRRAALQIDTVLEYGIEIAGALAAAHRQGIIHRDLKPQNIMLTKSGIKLLDFGLAKSLTSGPSPGGRGEKVLELQPSPHGRGWPEGPGEGAMAEPTAAEPLTAQGAIMGTLHYMAPEQLEGKPVDARTDIFAFGCVLYEMATGKRAFEGESSAQVMAAIMQNDPAPMVGAGLVPALGQPTHAATSATQGHPQGVPLQRAVKKCLAKDPDERWQSAADLKEALNWIREGDVVAAGLSRQPENGGAGQSKNGGVKPPLHRALPWALAAISLLGCVVLAIVSARNSLQPKTEESVIRFSVSPPENTNLGIYGGEFSLSPDGRRLAYVAGTTEKRAQLYVRSLDDLTAKPLPGTEDAGWPFWSPDGRFLGFYADAKLKKVEVSGGPVQTLCDAAGAGATWNREGVIVFTNQGRLYRVADAGGAPALVAAPDATHQEGNYLLPQFLPDGRHFIFVESPNINTNTSIKVGSLDSKDIESLLEANSFALYSPPGFLLYVRAGTLMARAFDAQRLRFTADAVPIAENVVIGGNSNRSYFSVSPNGVLAYQTNTGIAMNQMAWFDRKGAKLGTVGEAGVYTSPTLSPDGTKVAVGLLDRKLNTRDIWVYDLKRGAGSRLTFDPAEDFSPAWSPDGSRIMFTSTRQGQRDIYQKAANGLGTTELVFASKQQAKSFNDWSPDGRYAIYDTTGNPTNLWTLPLFGELTPFAFVQGSFWAAQGQFSPNGRYLAYASEETGRREVYVQRFPQHLGKWQVSTSGGMEPTWRRDGQELFYLGPDNKVMAVDVKTDSAQFEAGVPKPLFQAQLIGGAGFWRNRYVVSPDGQRFLMIVPAGEQTKPSPITVVVNWPALLKDSGK